MKKPDIEIREHFPVSDSSGVSRIEIEGLDQWDIREGYDEMMDALDFSRVVIVEALSGKGDRGAWEDCLNEVRAALKKAGCEL